MQKPSKKSSLDYTKVTLATATLLLAVSTLVLGITSHTKNVVNADSPAGIYADLGTMDYTFSGGKAIRQDDANEKALLAVLRKSAQKDIDLGCRAAYYTVKSFNADKTQVRLGYGCAEPSSPMFAVKANDTWQLLSPTNHFDTFGNPDCGYVNERNIDRQVAPICVSNWSKPGETPQYTVR